MRFVRSSGVGVKEMTNATNQTNRAVDTDAPTPNLQIVVAGS